MSLLRHLCVFVLIAASCVIRAVEAPPIVSVVMSDGDRLRQHWDASVYGQVWSDPGMAPLRAKLDTMLQEAVSEMGFNPLTVLQSLKQLSLTVSDVSLAEDWQHGVKIRAQIDLGEQAVAVIAALRAHAPVESGAITGADEALLLDQQGTTLARFGSTLVLTTAKAGAPTVQPIAATAHDFVCGFDTRSLEAVVREAAAGQPDKQRHAMEQALTSFKRFFITGDGWSDIITTGSRGHFSVTDVAPWVVPVDLSICKQLSGSVYSMSAVGLDGQKLWDDLHQGIFALIGLEDGASEEEIIARADGALADIGLKVTLKELVSGFRGTVMMATTAGVPTPGYTFALPRSPAWDKVLRFACEKLQTELPADGQSALLTIPNMPLPLSLIADPTHWVISTDQALVSTWGQASNADWNASPLGVLAASQKTKNACAIMVGDAAAELRQYSGYVGMAMNYLTMFDQAEKQALMQGINHFIALATPSFETLRREQGRLVLDAESLIGGGSSSIAVVAIIAAIAIPNLLESRISANESAAKASLKSGVFPAEVQFQAGNYHDRNNNGIGDFGFFSEMAGGPVAGQPDLSLKLLPASWNAVTPQISGYRFAVFLPDGKGGALSADKDGPVIEPQAGQEPESAFVAYAWPVDSSTGRRRFAITHTGVVYVAPMVKEDGTPPQWNDVFGGEGTGWNDDPAWSVATDTRIHRAQSGPRTPDAKAAAALKSQVFPAEVQFQAGNYRDRDQNGIGDFGFFSEMSGAPLTGQANLTLELLPPAWNSERPEIDGYRFVLYLPDGADGALSAAQDGPLVDSRPGLGPHNGFVAYAWPVQVDKKLPRFAITAAGIVYTAMPLGIDAQVPPVWNDVFGGKGWNSPVTWKPYQR